MNENLGARVDGVIGFRSLTIPRYLFTLRKTSCILIFFNSFISMGSSKALSNTSAT